jgi:hypothetical protein
LRHEFFDPDEFGVFHEPGHWRVEDNVTAHKKVSSEHH